MSTPSSANAPRILVLVGNGSTPLQIQARLKELQKLLSSKLGTTVEPELIDSSTWYKTFFPSCGNWESWIWETVTGKDYSTRQPRFSGFIVTETPLGKANAGIVRLALRNNSAVLLCRNQADIAVVTDVVETEQSDWGANWDVTTKPFGG